MAFEGRCWRILEVIRSGPGAFLCGRCLMMYLISDGLKALGGGDRGSGSSSEDRTSEV